MLIDHIGWFLFPQTIVFRTIGRLSFPLFAFLIAEGSVQTKNINSYLNRLIIFGLISQIPYSLIFYLKGENPFSLNIFFTLSAGLFLIKLIQNKKYVLFGGSFILLAILDSIIHYDYGVYGLLIILSSYLFIKKPIWGSLALFITTFLESVIIPTGEFNISHISFANQIFAIFAILPILFYKGAQGRKISKWYFYFFYPVHLILLALIYYIFKI